jgi:hypothetical protein
MSEWGLDVGVAVWNADGSEYMEIIKVIGNRIEWVLRDNETGKILSGDNNMVFIDENENLYIASPFNLEGYRFLLGPYERGLKKNQKLISKMKKNDNKK